jgi:hypothetical protein
MILDMLATLRLALAGFSKKLTRAAILYPLFFLPKERKIMLERWVRGREQFKKLQRTDFVIVSFGKSGRTWLRVMLSRFFQIRYGLSDKSLIGFDNFHWRNRAIPKLFFTHDNYLKDYTGNSVDKADYYDKKVILLVRHPADVSVSQYHQWRYRMRPNKKVLNDYPLDGEDVAIFDFMVQRQAGLDKIIEFMNGWAQEMPRLNALLVVRYEDLKSEPAETLARILQFMGTPGNEAEIKESLAFASFDNMRKLETKRTFWLSGGRMVAKDQDNLNSYKVRRGKVGGYRDYFSETESLEINRIVQLRLAPEFGYTNAEA